MSAAPAILPASPPRPLGARARPLRVCFVNLGAYGTLDPSRAHPVGGEEVQHALLAGALARRADVSVSMVTCDIGQGRHQHVRGIDVHACYRPSAGVPGLRFIPRWIGLHRALDAADADVYYVSCAGALLGQVALFTSIKRRALVFRAASDGDCDPRRMLVGGAKERALYLLGLRRATQITVQTEDQRRMLRTRLGRDGRVVPMLVDAPATQASSVSRDIDVLWVANLRSLKQPEKLVALARRLPHRRFCLVGGAVAGEEDVARRLHAAVADTPNVQLAGRLPYRDTLARFDRARLFVNTSRIEGFPNTFLQAWSRGVPVVSFIDPDGLIARAGLGAAVDDDDALAEQVERLLADPAALRLAQERSLAWAATHCAAEPVVETVVSLLRDAAQTARGG
jgi:glycosyltransferase involved in cell wall biosynthesis